jgi:hypothetical protein
MRARNEDIKAVVQFESGTEAQKLPKISRLEDGQGRVGRQGCTGQSWERRGSNPWPVARRKSLRAVKQDAAPPIETCGLKLQPMHLHTLAVTAFDVASQRSSLYLPAIHP